MNASLAQEEQRFQNIGHVQFMNADVDGCSDSEEDPLDAEEFDHIAFINKRFPNEVALQELDSYVERLRYRHDNLQQDIRRSLQEQAVAGDRARAGLDEAQDAVQELLRRISTIKGKAAQSEVLVSDVCRDIKSLDNAKRNLTGTVLALKRVHMLVSALDQLRSLMSSRQYAQASKLVHIVENLSKHLQEFRVLERVAVLLERKVTIIGDLKVQLLSDYASVITNGVSACEGVEEAYHCVNALGRSVKEEVITQFALRMLEDYKSIFQPPAEASSLDTVARRFQWLKKALSEFDERYDALFPESWRVSCGLCEHFCHVTRQHLVEVLTASNRFDPESVVRALKTSIDFENQLARKFREDDGILASPVHQANCVSFAHDFGFKYAEVLDEEQQAPTMSLSVATYVANGMTKIASTFEEAAEVIPRFRGIISECFDDYIGSWVRFEETELMKLLPTGQDKIVGNDDGQDEDEDDTGLEPKYILGSAPELFAEMKKSMTKCSAFSTEKILFSLFQAFQRVISKYLERLVSQMPKATAALDADGIRRVCAVIGTAEYFDETLPMLGESLLRVIDMSYRDQVNFSNEQDSAGRTMNRAMQVLVMSSDRNLDEVFGKMNKVAWEKFAQEVEDQSVWVSEIPGRLSLQLEPVAKDLSKLHYRFFCDKFVQAFVVRFINEIIRCRKISEQGAQQLLLDASIMKTALLEAPVSANKGRPMSTAFNNYVQREMGRIEAMLKVLSSPDMDEDSIRTMMGDAASEDDVKRVLSLRLGYEGDPVAVPPREVSTWAENAFAHSAQLRSGMQKTSTELKTQLKNKFTNFHGISSTFMSNQKPKARAKQHALADG